MENAVIYARYSSHGQNEQTIEGQIRVCKEYAKNKKLKIIDTYIDRHKTGTDDKRPQFLKMIDDSASGRFQYVIVYMIDRFSRNRYQSTVYNFRLAQNNVKLLSAMENISESEEGEFYQMFLEWNAEKYSKRLSKRVTEGLTTSVNNGTFTGGRLIYGYKIVYDIPEKRTNPRVFIKEDEAETVKYIFNEYAKGTTKKDIAEALNNKGIRHNGKLWQSRDFEHMLVNRKYTGHFELGGRECNETFPQIIDDILFSKVQKRAQANKHSAGSNATTEKYLLQGKAYCGMCGANMVGDSGTGRSGTQYHYYSCSNNIKKHTCKKAREKKDFLEWYVTEQTVLYLSDENRLKIIADDVIKYYESRTDKSEINRIIQESTKTKKEIDNSVNLMISGVSPETVKILDAKIVELNRLLNDLTEQRERLEFEQKLKVTRKDIIDFVHEFTNGENHDKEFQKRIIDNLVNAVYVYDDKVIIYFNINGGKEMSFIGKAETDEAMEDLYESKMTMNTELSDDSTDSKNVRTLSHSLRHKKAPTTWVLFSFLRIRTHQDIRFARRQEGDCICRALPRRKNARVSATRFSDLFPFEALALHMSGANRESAIPLSKPSNIKNKCKSTKSYILQ